MSIRVRCPARARAVAVAFFVLQGLLGCGSGSEAAPAADGGAAGAGPRITLGSGHLAYEEVPRDGHVPLIMGLQGGFHVWTSFVVDGFSSNVVRMQLSTRWAERDESLVEMAGSVALRPVLDVAGNEVRGSLGWPATIFEPTCANGQRLRLAVTVTDEAGISASDDGDWVVDVPEEYRSSECGP